VRFLSNFKRRRIVHNHLPKYVLNYQTLHKANFFDKKYKIRETNYFAPQEVINKAPSHTSNKEKVT